MLYLRFGMNVRDLQLSLRSGLCSCEEATV